VKNNRVRWDDKVQFKKPRAVGEKSQSKGNQNGKKGVVRGEMQMEY